MANTGEWPDPTPEMLKDPLFEAIWQAIKTWDINVPDVYVGYCGASGNHVRAVLEAIQPTGTSLHIVFDGPPGPTAGRFVEVETPDGRSVSAGTWHERDDGLWELRLEQPTGSPEVPIVEINEHARTAIEQAAYERGRKEGQEAMRKKAVDYINHFGARSGDTTCIKLAIAISAFDTEGGA